MATATNDMRIRDILDPVCELDLDSLVSNWSYVLHPNYTPKPNTPQASYYTGTHSAHNYTYDVNGNCPALTTAYIVIFDDTIGVFRRLSTSELFRAQSLPDTFSFPPDANDQQKFEQIGRSTEGSCVRALGAAIYPHIYAVARVTDRQRSL